MGGINAFFWVLAVGLSAFWVTGVLQLVAETLDAWRDALADRRRSRAECDVAWLASRAALSSDRNKWVIEVPVHRRRYILSTDRDHEDFHHSLRAEAPNAD